MSTYKSYSVAICIALSALATGCKKTSTPGSGAGLTITAMSPSTGADSTQVTLTGTGFSANASQDSVFFNGVAATISSASTTVLVVLVPARAGTGDVSVKVAGTTARGPLFTFQLTTEVSIFAGNGNINDVTGQGTAASFFYPTSLALDASGTLFVGEAGGGIRTVSPMALVANFPITFLGGFDPLKGGSPNLAQGLFLAFDPFLNVLLVSDPVYAYISATSTGVPFNVVPAVQHDFEPPVGTVATNPDPSYPYIFQYNSPIGIFADTKGTIYVSNHGDNFIQRFVVLDTINYPGAGTDTGNAPTVNTTGLASGGLVKSPNGLCADANGNVYVANGGGNNILKITSAGVVSVFAGSTSGTPGTADGTGTDASFYYPTNVVIDGQGNLYVADTENQRVRVITPAGEVSTIVYQFSFISGLAVNASGTTLYAADMFGCRIYKITFQ